MDRWTQKLLTIWAILLATTSQECHGDGIPRNLVVPHDFLTNDPYVGTPHFDAPISIAEDLNDFPHKAVIKKKDHFGLAVHPPVNHPVVVPPINPAVHHPPIHNPIHSPIHPPIHAPIHPPVHAPIHSAVHPPIPIIKKKKPGHATHAVHTIHSVHSPIKTVSTHSVHTTHSTHATHAAHGAHSAHASHTSASSLHPKFPLPAFAPLNLGYDPYLYTHPFPDKGAYFPEHGYNVLEKLDEVHHVGDLAADHYFPPLGYNLDPYFNDFPVFGYFDFSPKFDDHHRRRRGTTEPRARRQLPSTIFRPSPPADSLDSFVPVPNRSRFPKRETPRPEILPGNPKMPGLPARRVVGQKSEFFS